MTETAEKLAELESRIRNAEEKTQQYRKKLSELEAGIEAGKKLFDKGRELTQALENQVRERNERILKLEQDADFGRRFRELLEEVSPPVSHGGTGKAELANVKWQVSVHDEVRKVEASDTTTCRGRLLKLGKDGFFNKHRTFGEIMDEFPKRGWADSDKTISNTLTAMFGDGLIAKHNPGQKRAMEYFLPESVKYA